MIQSKLFVDLLDAPYSRRGSYLAFANDNAGENLFGKCTLWLCNCRILGGGVESFNTPNGFRQVKLEAVKNGKALPCVISTTPYEVILETNHGAVRFCIGARRLVMCTSTDGISLRITPTLKFLSPGIVNLLDGEGAYLVDFRASRLLVKPLGGTLKAYPAYLELSPDQNGDIRLALEDFMVDPEPRPRADYPSYEDCVESVKADFDDFCARVMPGLPAAFEPKRLQALWYTWSMIVEPDGESDYRHTMVKMVHGIFEAAFVWQQPMQAVWLSRDPELAWEVFCSGFDHQDKNGRLTDALGFKALPNEGLKPPVHGLMLLWLMDNGKLADVPAESKERVLDGLIRWTEYFFKFRDKDKDGLAEFQSLIETGWEDAPYFNVGFPCASPDLNALLAAQMDAVARLGREVGRPEAECAAWEARADALTRKIVEKFWDGERWFAFNAETGQRSDSATIPLYLPLVLGKKLPQEVIDKSLAYIFGPDGFDTPYGLATESPASDYFAHGFTKGSVITPAEFLMCLAFEACARSDLARAVAVKYCAALREHGFFHIHNALTGKEDRSLTAFGERGLFWSAWSSSCYFFLADRYGARAL
ncbi:Trehalase [Sporobacter termitidis DSM 10068]|uniref:Trehalase n=1 Tax=Sporobacter termitidis DSM 10068 TaxID=1123282 RepID=A0A1M5XI38_9FIRM|nr:trehalase family glycosidase [Sporobacter termitidis]SHH99480.1 Trehalase [Sporobacter termitidis DSM 10068]